MQLFSADATMFLKKFKNYFLTLKTLKKTPKSCILMAVGSFFLSAATTAQNSPELHFNFINYFILSGRIFGGGSRKWPVLLMFSTAFMLIRWMVGVRKTPKICWHNIGMVPKHSKVPNNCEGCNNCIGWFFYTSIRWKCI